jgi:riboflavin kinase/FMN adenylyltransferase
MILRPVNGAGLKIRPSSCPEHITCLTMQIFRGFHHAALAPACALTIGNFDGVHRGHQAMLALLRNEAQHRDLPATVLTFEPHPRDYFAALTGKSELAPARIATLRDKLSELERCGVDQVVVVPFDQRLASLTPQAFIDDVLVNGLKARYVLVGDDFRFGAKRAGDHDLLDAEGDRQGFDVARMMSYEVHGLRVSSSVVRDALAAGDMPQVERLLGRPYTISGHVIHGAKLGRSLDCRTLNVRFGHENPPPPASLPSAPTACPTNLWKAWPAWACAPPWKTPAACCWRSIALIGPPPSARKGATVKSCA